MMGIDFLLINNNPKFLIPTICAIPVNSPKIHRKIKIFSMPFFIFLFASAVLLPVSLSGSEPRSKTDPALIGTWSAEWGGLTFTSRSIKLNEDGTFFDKTVTKKKNERTISTEISGIWETIEGCVIKLSIRDGENIGKHNYIYYRFERGDLCSFSTSTILLANDDGTLSSGEKTYSRKYERDKEKTTIEGIWIDQSTGAMAFSFYRNGTFVRDRLSGKPEQWSQIGYEFLLWESPRIYKRIQNNN